MLRAATFSLLLTALLARAGDAPGYKVIVHSSNPVRAMKKDDLARLFLKKSTLWPDGRPIQPVDQADSARVREVFSRSILDRSILSIKSYWRQRIFSGADVPPPELVSDAAVVTYVKEHAGSIGYVSAKRPTDAGVAVLRVEGMP